MPLYMNMTTGFLSAVTGEATAIRDDRKVELLGSCAIFQQRHILLTAAHCIPDPELGVEIWASLPGNNDGAALVQEVVVHPTSDLAVAFVSPKDDDPMSLQVFSGISGELQEGGDFVAFGYPSEGVGAPKGRLFKGHFQRYIGHDDAAGRSYFAGELSIPAPGGLSGGPVSPAYQPGLLTAIVTTNVDSYAILDSISEVDDAGKQYREETRRVISYGIAAMLTSQGAWVDSVIDSEQRPSHSSGPPLRREVPVP
jgi:hypothetical protein